MSAWPAPSATTNVAVTPTVPVSPKRREAGLVALLEPPNGDAFPPPNPAIEADPPPESDPQPDPEPDPDFEAAFGFSFDYSFRPETESPPAPGPTTAATAWPAPTSLRRSVAPPASEPQEPVDEPSLRRHSVPATRIFARHPAPFTPSPPAAPLEAPAAPPAIVDEAPAEPVSPEELAPVVPLAGPSVTRTILSSVVRFASLFWCWTILWMAMWTMVPTLVGWSPTVVTSGSMEPSLRVGSVVHVDPNVDLDAIGAGAILTFQDPAIPGLRVTHRVTGIERVDGIVTGFRTKGDANATVDSTIVPVENVEGVARLMVPYAGTPKVWAQNGQWVHFGVFVLLTAGAAAISIDTIIGFVSGRRGGGRRRRRRRIAGTAIAIAAMLGAPSSSAAFTATTDAPGNTFDMTSQWHLDAIDRQSPVAHWRLGEAASGVTVITDDFEHNGGYSSYGSGRFRGSKTQAHSGRRSGLKSSNNDPNGGWRSLSSSIVGNNFVFEIWVYRPSGGSGGSTDQVGLEDSSLNGYTFDVDHVANTLGVDRRVAGLPVGIGATVPFDPPEDTWYRLEMVRSDEDITINAYDGIGTLLATTSATDGTTSTFDRFVARGGFDYYVDDLTVTQFNSPLVAVDRIGTIDGIYVGDPIAGKPGLVVSDADTAVSFDGSADAALIGDAGALNLTSRAERTTELWFQADTTLGRQAIYEEGGSTDGLNIYLDGTTLYAHSWSDSTGWSNNLLTSTTIAAGTRYHVAVTLDAVTARSLILYVDGVAVSTATKTDAGLWNAHSDNGAIAQVNGSSKFHDGNVGGGYHFDGTVDEVVIYNSVLSAPIIANHHNAGR